MPWFKVDDHFHSHRKTLATSPAALGLWVIAGSWAAANPDDGFVPAHVLPRLLPDFEPLADELVERRLWQRVKGGYKFRNWAEYQFTKDEIETKRERDRERQRRYRAKKNAQSLTDDSHASNTSFTGDSHEIPAKKDGSRKDNVTGVNRGRPGTESRSPQATADTVTELSQRESQRDNSVSHRGPTQPNPTQPISSSSYVANSPSVEPDLPDGNDVRSKPVNVQAAIISREYTDRVKIADRAKVAGVVQQAIDGGYEHPTIRSALRRLAKDNRPVTPDTLRIEITGGGKREPAPLITPPRNGMRGREGW